jgi:hypothetical protein
MKRATNGGCDIHVFSFQISAFSLFVMSLGIPFLKVHEENGAPGLSAPQRLMNGY